RTASAFSESRARLRSFGSAGERAPALSTSRSAAPLARGGAERALVVLAIDEARIAEAGADGEDAPALQVLHEWHLAQPLHHRVVVQQHRGIVLADRRDLLAQRGRKIESLARPVARQVLRAAIDRAVLLDLARTADADEWRDLVALLVGVGDQLLQHCGELLDVL